MKNKIMNRIIIGNGKSKFEKVEDDKVIIDIKEDVNLYIDSKYNNYVINVDCCKVNILLIREKSNNIDIKLNINKSFVSFNNISYLSSNLKLEANLNSKESKILINNSVISSKKVCYDVLVNHNYANTISDIYNNGVTKDDGSIIFNVVSKVPKKSIKSIVNQDSKIITLNDISESKINPILLIDEYDSEAKHSAFIGNFKTSELFYMQSRGLSKKEASNLLIRGMLIGTLDLCFDEKEKLKDKLNTNWR